MSTEVQSFYGRWARAYDLLASHAPGVSRARAGAADALALSAGDTVLEVGCGTGANVPYLADRVGPDGRVLGLDATRGVLDRAGRRNRGRENVALLRGDARSPPVDGPVDGVLASLVTGLLGDPAAAVESWCDLLAPGGRLVVLEATTSDHPAGRLANPLFRAFVRAANPGRGAGAAASLDRRVAVARDAARARAGSGVRERTYLGGFVSAFVVEM